MRKGEEGNCTTSVNADAIDEAHMADKSLDDNIGVICDSVDVIDVMKSVYKFKASDCAQILQDRECRRGFCCPCDTPENIEF